MGIVTVVYERNLGPVPALEPGEWTLETASGRPAIRCGSCGGIYDLPETHRVDETGFVVPALRCEYVPCDAYAYVRLLNYSDEVLT